MIEDILRTRYYDCLTGLDIYENTNSIKLPRIIVKPECRGNGIGTSIMNDLIEYADKNKQIIALTPASDFGGNKNRLIDFYKRFGFKMNKGHHKSYQFQDSINVLFVRYSAKSLSSSLPPILKLTCDLILVNLAAFLPA